jgi:hypothetical protein
MKDPKNEEAADAVVADLKAKGVDLPVIQRSK